MIDLIEIDLDETIWCLSGGHHPDLSVGSRVLVRVVVWDDKNKEFQHAVPSDSEWVAGEILASLNEQVHWLRPLDGDEFPLVTIEGLTGYMSPKTFASYGSRIWMEAYEIVQHAEEKRPVKNVMVQGQHADQYQYAIPPSGSGPVVLKCPQCDQTLHTKPNKPPFPWECPTCATISVVYPDEPALYYMTDWIEQNGDGFLVQPLCPYCHAQGASTLKFSEIVPGYGNDDWFFSHKCGSCYQPYMCHPVTLETKKLSGTGKMSYASQVTPASEDPGTVVLSCPACGKSGKQWVFSKDTPASPVTCEPCHQDWIAVPTAGMVYDPDQWESLLQAGEKALKGNAKKFQNFYQCPSCNEGWNTEWDSLCNDQCPYCGQKDVEPYTSHEIEQYGNVKVQCPLCNAVTIVVPDNWIDDYEWHTCDDCMSDFLVNPFTEDTVSDDTLIGDPDWVEGD